MRGLVVSEMYEREEGRESVGGVVDMLTDEGRESVRSEQE